MPFSEMRHQNRDSSRNQRDSSVFIGLVAMSQRHFPPAGFMHCPRVGQKRVYVPGQFRHLANASRGKWTFGGVRKTSF